jgi:hypothetical protein
MRTRKSSKYVGMKQRSCRLNQAPYTEIKKESDHLSLTDHSTSQPSLDISSIWPPVITAEVKNLQLRPVQIEWENLCVGTIRRTCLSSDDFYSDISLVQGLIRVEILIL